MKKLLTSLLMMVLAVTVASARDRYTSDVNTLPQLAQQILKQHFGKVAVNHIKIESHTFGGDDYEVILDNGTEVDFNSKGEWTDIEAGRRGVPASIIPAEINKHLKAQYSKQKVVSIDRDKKGYELKLTNGLELRYNKYGHFLGFDD